MYLPQVFSKAMVLLHSIVPESFVDKSLPMSESHHRGQFNPYLMLRSCSYIYGCAFIPGPVFLLCVLLSDLTPSPVGVVLRSFSTVCFPDYHSFLFFHSSPDLLWKHIMTIYCHMVCLHGLISLRRKMWYKYDIFNAASISFIKQQKWGTTQELGVWIYWANLHIYTYYMNQISDLIPSVNACG